MKPDREEPEEALPPLVAVTGHRWRVFVCNRCGEEKRKWMFWTSLRDAQTNTDHRQQCGVCNRITAHTEILPSE